MEAGNICILMLVKFRNSTMSCLKKYQQELCTVSNNDLLSVSDMYPIL